ncbi:MAG: hypothetical protein L0229_23265 [Blastocatellia bacterium]|nr:hypothetical protein [Blastocatellia bacterium]
MGQRLVISVFLGLLALTVGCGKDQSLVDSKPAEPSGDYDVASPSKEIIAQNVLAVQLAARHEFESRTTFAPTEPIQASLYLTDSSHIEPRRISALLVSDEAVVEEQSITIGADEKRQEFDFRFAKTPRPLGIYRIRFVEIARSNGKPVLLAQLFLNVE